MAELLICVLIGNMGKVFVAWSNCNTHLVSNFTHSHSACLWGWTGSVRTKPILIELWTSLYATRCSSPHLPTQLMGPGVTSTQLVWLLRSLFSGRDGSLIVHEHSSLGPLCPWLHSVHDAMKPYSSCHALYMPSLLLPPHCHHPTLCGG